MNESLEELACSYVLDQLDDRERTAFAARLLREPELAALVRDLESNLERGIRSLPQRPPPAGLFARIEAQIETSKSESLDPAQAGPNKPAPSRPATSGLPSPASSLPRQPLLAALRWGLAAVIAVSLATLAVQSLRRPAASPTFVLVGLYDDQNSFSEVPLRIPAADPDARFMQLAGLAEGFWRQADKSTGKPDDKRGYALFDPSSQQGFIAIEQLPALSGKQQYHLWIVDPGTNQVHDAGTLPLAGANRGLYSFALPAVDGSKPDRPGIFITAEEAGSTPQPDQPRGKVVLGNRPI